MPILFILSTSDRLRGIRVPVLTVQEAFDKAINHKRRVGRKAAVIGINRGGRDWFHMVLYLWARDSRRLYVTVIEPYSTKIP